MEKDIKRNIEYLESMLKFEKSINPNSGNVSFLEYQLNAEKQKLKKLNSEVSYVYNMRKK